MKDLPINTFKNLYYETWIDNGIICKKYHPGVIIDLEAAKIIHRDRLTFAQGKNFPYYIDVREAKYWTREARAFQALEENSFGINAFAMHTSSIVQKTIINFYSYFNKPFAPTKAFYTKANALQWLNHFK